VGDINRENEDRKRVGFGRKMTSLVLVIICTCVWNIQVDISIRFLGVWLKLQVMMWMDYKLNIVKT
jgi:hypothetical protein